MMVDLTELRAKAEAATPGPWSADRKRQIGPRSIADDQSYGMLIPCVDACSDEDAAFIAAANPAVVLALLDRVEKAEAERTLACDELGAVYREISRLRALLARAGEALRPFAGIGVGTNPDYAPMIRLDRDAILTSRTIAREIEEAIGHE